VQLPDVFAEISLRRFSESQKSERSAIPQRHGICVIFKDFLLRQFALKMDRNQQFVEFARPGLMTVQPKILGKLLRQRRSALCALMLPEIYPKRFHDSLRIETRMLKKPLIFDRDDGIH